MFKYKPLFNYFENLDEFIYDNEVNKDIYESLISQCVDSEERALEIFNQAYQNILFALLLPHPEFYFKKIFPTKRVTRESGNLTIGEEEPDFDIFAYHVSYLLLYLSNIPEKLYLFRKKFDIIGCEYEDMWERCHQIIDSYSDCPKFPTINFTPLSVRHKSQFPNEWEDISTVTWMFDIRLTEQMLRLIAPDEQEHFYNKINNALNEYYDFHSNTELLSEKYFHIDENGKGHWYLPKEWLDSIKEGNFKVKDLGDSFHQMPRIKNPFDDPLYIDPLEDFSFDITPIEDCSDKDKEIKELKEKNAQLEETIKQLKQRLETADAKKQSKAKKILENIVVKLKPFYIEQKDGDFDIVWEEIYELEFVNDKILTNSPNNFEGGFNLKLLLNICGFLHSEKKLDITLSELAKLIGGNENRRSYISGFKLGGSNSELTRENIEELKKALKKVDYLPF